MSEKPCFILSGYHQELTRLFSKTPSFYENELDQLRIVIAASSEEKTQRLALFCYGFVLYLYDDYLDQFVSPLRYTFEQMRVTQPSKAIFLREIDKRFESLYVENAERLLAPGISASSSMLDRRLEIRKDALVMARSLECCCASVSDTSEGVCKDIGRKVVCVLHILNRSSATMLDFFYMIRAYEP